MDVRHLLSIAVLALGLSGCATTTTTADGSKRTSLDIGPAIGLFGMAVDGDDKDDYEHFFDNDDCKCRH